MLTSFEKYIGIGHLIRETGRERMKERERERRILEIRVGIPFRSTPKVTIGLNQQEQAMLLLTYQYIADLLMDRG